MDLEDITVLYTNDEIPKKGQNSYLRPSGYTHDFKHVTSGRKGVWFLIQQGSGFESLSGCLRLGLHLCVANALRKKQKFVRLMHIPWLLSTELAMSIVVNQEFETSCSKVRRRLTDNDQRLANGLL